MIYRYDSRAFNSLDAKYMSKEDKIEVEGTIIQSLPGLVFEVQLPVDL
jgi:hypothetical protein